MENSARDIVFVGGKRTPFGAMTGSLKHLSATDLGVHAAKAVFAETQVPPADVDQVIFGNVLQTSADAIYLARHIGLRAGVPEVASALTVNRLCGSGFQSLISAAEQVMLGQARVVLAGGAESMSQAPHTLRGARSGWPLGKPQIGDYLWEALHDPIPDMPMAHTAEKLGDKYQITRAACDEYSVRSQHAYAAAHAKGHFADEMAPIDIVERKETRRIENDEHPRPKSTIDALSKLPAYFKKDGLVTAGSASGITDGAAAMLLMSSEEARKRNCKPLGRLVSWGFVGCDPSIMGIGPAPAARKALETAKLGLKDMDLIEVNEAFAPQYLAVEKELGLDRSKTNVNGGAIAIGHPLAASGTRLTMTLLYELRRRGKRYGLASACIGGGQGIALIVEAI